MELQDKIRFFRETIACNAPLYYFLYDDDGQTLEYDCPKPNLFYVVLRNVRYYDTMVHAEAFSPFILFHQSGIVWISEKTVSKEGTRIYVFGPFFDSHIDPQHLAKLTDSISSKSHTPEGGSRIIRLFQNLPAIPSLLYNQYALLLHYCLTGKHILFDDIKTITEAIPQNERGAEDSFRAETVDRVHIYRAEQALLQHVRNGNADAIETLRKAALVQSSPPYTSSPLRNRQLDATSFITKCTQAAIDGGMTVAAAYALGDAFIRSASKARSLQEVNIVIQQMYFGFIKNVQKCRSSKQFSPSIRSCCDYIALHYAEPISIELLSSRLGYAKYYLSSQFKKETGASVSAYIKFTRIERAKLLLETTDDPIEKIGLLTGFNSRSFFERVFKEIVGCTPREYRDNHQMV